MEYVELGATAAITYALIRGLFEFLKGWVLSRNTQETSTLTFVAELIDKFNSSIDKLTGVLDQLSKQVTLNETVLLVRLKAIEDKLDAALQKPPES